MAPKNFQNESWAYLEYGQEAKPTLPASVVAWTMTAINEIMEWWASRIMTKHKGRFMEFYKSNQRLIAHV